ncbi:MAG: glycosyltransferase [Bacteroidota bacterium]
MPWDLPIWAYFLYVASYTFIFSLAARISASRPLPIIAHNTPLAYLIPAYREDAVILSTVKALLAVRKTGEVIIVVADGLQPHTLQALSEWDVLVQEVQFATSSKVKSLRVGLERVPDQIAHVLILDADNHLDPQAHPYIAALLQQGWEALQIRRIAKNLDSHWALLDGLSEALNQAIYRAGPAAIGWAPQLSGSGMVFEKKLLKACLAGWDTAGGFDRELEIQVLQRGKKIAFLGEAVIWDEKVNSGAVFSQQRRRWVSSQYHFLRKHWRLGWRGLWQGNGALFHSSVLRNIQLPRVLNLGLLSLWVLLKILLGSMGGLTLLWWVGLWGMLVAGVGLAIPRSYLSFRLFQALWILPGAFWRMFMVLFRLQKADQAHYATPHEETEHS